MKTQFEITTLIVRNMGKFKIKESSKLVLLTLSTFYPEIRPKVRSIIDLTGISESSVTRGLNELSEKGFIIRQNECFTLNLNAINLQNDCKKVVKMTDHEQNKIIKYNKNNFNNKGTDGIWYQKYVAEHIKPEDTAPPPEDLKAVIERLKRTNCQ